MLSVNVNQGGSYRYRRLAKGRHCGQLLEVFGTVSQVGRRLIRAVVCASVVCTPGRLFAFAVAATPPLWAAGLPPARAVELESFNVTEVRHTWGPRPGARNTSAARQQAAHDI